MRSKTFIALSAVALLSVGGGVAYLLLPDGQKTVAPVRQSLVQETGDQASVASSQNTKSASASGGSELSAQERQGSEKAGSPEIPRNQSKPGNVVSRSAGAQEELSTASPDGERVIAKISNDGFERTLTPNEIGHFPRVFIKPNQIVPITLSFPDGSPEDAVVIQVEDGGGVDSNLVSKIDRLDTLKSLRFEFKANADLGTYRVVLRKGADVRVLNFWVGDEQPMAKR